MRTHRRFIAALSAAGVRACREAFLLRVPDVVRVAVLVEISAAAASLARTIVKLRHVDVEQVAPYVTDGTDLRAVLGQGRWLPSMTRHVPAPISGRAARRAVAAGQQVLFVLDGHGR